MSTASTKTPFATIDEAIDEIRRGKMVVVCDDEDRENEGDLVMAAQLVTPEAINFMARGDAPPDRPGDRAGPRPDPRRGRQAQPACRREDHAQVAHRRRPAAADRRGARRDRLLAARGEPLIGVAHRIYARALFEAAQEEGKLDEVRKQVDELRAAATSVDDLRLLLENPEIGALYLGGAVNAS